MKKSLKALLLTLSCLCAATTAACAAAEINVGNSSSGNDKESGSSSVTPPTSSSTTEDLPTGTLEVDFVEGDGYKFVSDTLDGSLVSEGDEISFSVDMSVFYTGYPVVSINGKAIAPNNEGIYNVTVNEPIAISVSGVQKEVSNMSGTGSFEDAFVVSRPIDLLYIAEQVNKGVYAYVTGAYVLANDIDCGGEELEIIGDMSTENSYFSGCFTCYTDPNTGAMVSNTISNFVINSDSTNYVGLFGTVYADLSVTSSGLFYGINLDNFTINASLSKDVMLANRSISAGGLIGYGVGANVYLCNATNGEINVYGDTNYFSFAGGLIGYQQAFYLADYGMNFSSEVVYSHADVDVRIMQGMALYAGGISGYLATNTPSGATAYIHDSYATGNVSGALRAGGVVGGLGQYTSVGNCYSTGEVFARATQSLEDILLTSEEYCYANAGGIVGFAENDTIVNDCFFDGKISASAPSKGCAQTNDIVGGGNEKGYASASSEKYIVNNCLTASDITTDATANKQLLMGTLGWGEFSWVFDGKVYPAINYETTEGAVTAQMTLVFVHQGEEILVKGESSQTIKYFDTATQTQNIYAPVGNYFLNEGLQRTIKADNGYLSFGYFFDAECTQKVPYSYVPQRNVTLYIGFADVSSILGTYNVAYKTSTAPISITLDADGYAHYTDGNTAQTSYYFYNGETIIIEGARLARYFDGEIVIDENATDTLADAYFDLNRYSYYDFTGVFTAMGELKLYDGTFFTETDPLYTKRDLFRGEYYTSDGTIYKFYGSTATAENGLLYHEYTYVKDGDVLYLTSGSDTISLNISELNSFDEFKGTWTKSATINKSYYFDGMGNWTYQYISYERTDYSYEQRIIEQRSGTYYVSGDTLYLNGSNIKASFVDGFLVINDDGEKQNFYAAHSYVGTWQLANVQITLLGIGANGYGDAILDYGDGMKYDLVYELSETTGYVCLYWAHDVYTKDALFGYFTYDAATNTLLATLSDSNNASTGYSQGNLFVIDDYNGEWICDVEEFKNIEFQFNGNGLYGFLYGYSGMEGELILLDLTTNTKKVITYKLDSTLKGQFAYDGVRYVMEYDEDLQAVVLKASGVNAQLQRKDPLANVNFVDVAGNKYSFDGRSNLLSTGGKLVVNGKTEYGYVVSENGWDVKDGDTTVGTLKLSDNKAYYQLTIHGETSNLYLHNEFIGEWAIGGEYGKFTIGPTDLNGNIQAVYKGHDVEISTLEPNLLTFKYKDGNMPITYYIFVVYDELLKYNVLVLSQYTNLYSGGYSICTKANELYGKWTRNDGQFTVQFDGVTSGSYTYGQAILSRGNTGNTAYYYRITDKGSVMWTQETLGGKTVYFKIEMLDMATATSEELNAADVYVQKNAQGEIIGAFKRISADGLYLTEAKDKAGNVYFFDGGNANGNKGKLYVNDVYVYDYVIKSYNTNNTVTIELTEVATKNKYTATLDYSSGSNFVITIA